MFARLHSDKPSVIVLILLIIASAWMIIGNLFELQLTKESLRHFRAPLRDIKIETYKCSGRSRYSLTTCQRTIVTLQGISGRYKIVERGTDNSYSLLQPGDTIDVYARKWYQYFYTLGRYSAIYVLEKDGEVYYTFEDHRHEKFWIWIGVAVLILMSILLYVEVNTPRWLAAGKLR